MKFSHKHIHKIDGKDFSELAQAARFLNMFAVDTKDEVEVATLEIHEGKATVSILYNNLTALFDLAYCFGTHTAAARKREGEI